MTQYGPLFKMIIGLEPSVTVADYEVLEAVLASTKLIHKSKQYSYFHNWLGLGLLTSSGSKWRKRRKIITPAYHFQILELFVPVFNSVSDVLVQELKVEVGRDSTDIYPYITLCALDVICETAMGTSVNAQINKNSVYVLAVKEMCAIIMYRVFSLQQFNLYYYFTENYKNERKCLKILNDYTMSVIRSRRKQLEDEDESSDFEDISSNKRKIAFLDLLLQSTVDGHALSDEDIREEVATFMFEGHDTTASAMSFALYAIADHPYVQNKILAEQRDIFGDQRDREVSWRDLQEMKYLEMVIKETLRLYPSVPFYAREVQEDIILDSNLFLPKGLTVNIFAYGIQRDPKYFPNPDLFDPERFDPANLLCKRPYSYIPFSAGPRNCIGQKFAMLEMKTILSSVLRYYELMPATPRHRPLLKAETILKSDNGIKVGLKERVW